MIAVCITLGGARQEKAIAHFAAHGLNGVRYFRALHAEKVGLSTLQTYEVDHPGTGWKMGPGPTGCWLAHRFVWAAIGTWPDAESEPVLILEDDAKLSDGFVGQCEQALRDVPDDWDGLYVGSCCTGGKPARHVKGSVYEVRYPLCTHAYMIRRKAIPALIESTDGAKRSNAPGAKQAVSSGCYAPIDISLAFHSWPRLRCYTVLPRIVGQWDTEIPI